MVRSLFLAYVITTLWCGLACKESDKQLQDKKNVIEPYRPVFHFTPPSHWMNDPNGLFYFEGEYHLFYQHYPDSTVWGPMHWGHAVSADLVHWEHLPIALYPDSLGLIFSGSVVIDENNTSGFGQEGRPPLVAIFTHHNMDDEKAGREDYEKQSIAYSNDRGRTWTKYANNPVLINQTGSRDFRDPKVFWYELTKSWIMITAVQDHIRLWSSDDLKKWKYQSEFGKEWGSHGGVWECPDLFPIITEDTHDTVWVLLQSINPGGPNGGSAIQYFIGNFDGKNFTLHPEFIPLVTDGKAMWVDHGPDNYAGVTWSGIPASDGRRLFLGWMSNWSYATVVPTKTWRSAMTIPRSLTVKNTDKGKRLISTPIIELQSLRKKTIPLKPMTFRDTLDITKNYSFNLSSFELELEFDVDSITGKILEIEIANDTGEIFKVGIDHKLNMFYMDRRQSSLNRFSTSFASSIHLAPRVRFSNKIKMQLFFDQASCELFADEGETIMTEIFFPTRPFHHFRILSPGSTTQLLKANIYLLH